jgi:adenine-specific DNA-methyltransferase
MEKMRMESVDMTAQNIDKIATLFPSCITETKGEDGKPKRAINFELLKQMLSDEVLEGDEAYEFTWVGKKAAIVEANKPIRKTLRPCKEESVNWDSTENLYIEGDNLEILKLLQESYLGKVKMIFIDPPYNTGSDFIYADDFTMRTERYRDETGEIDVNGNRMFQNTESNGRYHSDWCSMMYSRLMIARNLLAEDGSIFISIDYNEIDNLRKIMDELFGAENFQREIVWRIGWLSGYKTMAPNFIRNHDTILYYSKKSSNVKFFKRYIENKDFKPLIKKDAKVTEKLNELGLNAIQQKDLLEFINHGNRPDRYPIEDTWNCNEYDDLNSIAIVSFSGEKISKMLGIQQDFKGQKSIKMLKRIIEATTENDDIIMDFFSGTASTAHAVTLLNAEDGGNRRFIMVQLPELCDEESVAYKEGYMNICELGKERIRRAAKKIAEEYPDATFDGGFRVLKLDSSNMKDVYYAPAEYEQGMLSGLESNIKEDRTDLDLLFGCLLEWGLPLSERMTVFQIDGVDVHAYGMDAEEYRSCKDGMAFYENKAQMIDNQSYTSPPPVPLLACFADRVPESVIRGIAGMKPLCAVFRDSCFQDSPAKINVTEVFKLLAPDTRVKVI